MKTLVVFAFAVALCCTAALAGDGKVSRPSLSKMGLSGMKPMADQEGSRIRGQFLFYPPHPIDGIFYLPQPIYPPHPTGGFHFYRRIRSSSPSPADPLEASRKGHSVS
jgi:hypothetical protein